MKAIQKILAQQIANYLYFYNFVYIKANNNNQQQSWLFQPSLPIEMLKPLLQENSFYYIKTYYKTLSIFELEKLALNFPILNPIRYYFRKAIADNRKICLSVPLTHDNATPISSSAGANLQLQLSSSPPILQPSPDRQQNHNNPPYNSPSFHNFIFLVPAFCASDNLFFSSWACSYFNALSPYSLQYDYSHFMEYRRKGWFPCYYFYLGKGKILKVKHIIKIQHHVLYRLYKDNWIRIGSDKPIAASLSKEEFIVVLNKGRCDFCFSFGKATYFSKEGAVDIYYFSENIWERYFFFDFSPLQGA